VTPGLTSTIDTVAAAATSSNTTGDDTARSVKKRKLQGVVSECIIERKELLSGGYKDTDELVANIDQRVKKMKVAIQAIVDEEDAELLK